MRRSDASASISRCTSSTGVSSRGAAGQSRRLLHLEPAGAPPDRRAVPRDARTDADGDGVGDGRRRAARPCRRLSAARSLAARSATLSVVGISLPSFWIGLMLITTLSIRSAFSRPAAAARPFRLLGVRTSLLTADGWRHIVLPALNLSLLSDGDDHPPDARRRAAKTSASNYIRYARAKGLSPSRILFALRPAEHRHSARHGARHRVRRPAGFRRGHRNHLRLARHRQAHHRSHQDQRPPDHHRLPAVHRPAVHAHQSRGRHRLRADRPAHIACRRRNSA